MPNVPSVIGIWIKFVSGSASVDIEVSDDNPKVDPNPTFIPLQTVTQTAYVVISLPASVIAINTTSITGEIHVSYRMSVGQDYLTTPIQVFDNASLVAANINVSGTLTTIPQGTTSRIYGPAAFPASPATIYTTPGSKKAVLTNIHVANTTGTAAVFTLSIGTDAVGKRIYSGFSVAAHDVYHQDLNMILSAAELLQGGQTTADALTTTISGYTF